MIRNDPRIKINLLRGASLFGAVLLLLALAGWTLPAPAVDLILALDRSGSMQVYDPRHDSVAGVELFATLLESTDRLAFMTFAENGEPRLPLTSLADPKTRDEVTTLARRTPMTGALTNFEDGLRLAYELQTATPAPPGTERAVVIFTDGQIDLGTDTANRASQARIANDWLPKFQAAGIRIHGIAFSPWSDLALLRAMAEQTGGQAFRAETVDDIQAAFVKIFEAATQPLNAAIVNGKVQVDSSVNELRLLVKRDSPDEEIKITTPQGKTLTRENAGPEVDWQSSRNFDHVTIRQPAAGAWTLTGSEGEKQAWIASDLDLFILLPPAAAIGRRLPLTVQLINGSRQQPDPALLENVDFAVEILDEQDRVVRKLGLESFYTDDRVHEVRGDLRLDTPGNYRVRVTAASAHFTRSKDAFISVGEARAATQPTPPAQSSPLPAVAPLPGRTPAPAAQTQAAQTPAAPEPEPPAPDTATPAADEQSGPFWRWPSMLLLPPAPDALPPGVPPLTPEQRVRQTAIALMIWVNLALLILVGGFFGIRWLLRHGKDRARTPPP